MRLQGIPPRRWPALLLAGAAAVAVAATAPETVRRIAREWGARFAPPGSGEAFGSLLDHYRFLEALAPRVGPEDRLFVVTDRWPELPDLAYWFGPWRPEPPGTPRVTLRIRLDPGLLMRYLRGNGVEVARDFAVAGALRAIEGAGLGFDPDTLPDLVASADVVVALDTALDLREAAGGFGTLLAWSPRKFALRRGGRPR